MAIMPKGITGLPHHLMLSCLPARGRYRHHRHFQFEAGALARQVFDFDLPGGLGFDAQTYEMVLVMLLLVVPGQLAKPRWWGLVIPPALPLAFWLVTTFLFSGVRMDMPFINLNNDIGWLENALSDMAQETEKSAPSLEAYDRYRLEKMARREGWFAELRLRVGFTTLRSPDLALVYGAFEPGADFVACQPDDYVEADELPCSAWLRLDATRPQAGQIRRILKMIRVTTCYHSPGASTACD
ncbi:MAG: hypothetical protein U9N87_06985, partial [Planctomycetota bacterium]|nr:hypothetical protein [Planctomycetota bacterium]